jgi:hypothetical protein
MFFSISKSSKDNFISSHQLGSLYLNLDSGWSIAEDSDNLMFYKGYADYFKLSERLDEILASRVPEHTGNFCCIYFNKHTKAIAIRSDKYRGFPVYVHNEEITNLLQSHNVVFSNVVIDVHQDLSIVSSKFNLIGVVATEELPYADVLDKITDILDRKTQAFLSHNELPVRAFLSGGVDSLLVFTCLNKFTKNYSLVKEQHVAYDKFWMCNSEDLQKFWGYKQIHHWDTPTVLTSGTPGDEYMLRSPYTSDVYLQYHGMSLKGLSTSSRWSDSLHSAYFLNANLKEEYTTQAVNNVNNNKTILYWNLCNIVANDWQHWHLGQTLTWTPLRDLEIFKLILQLPFDHALEQMFDSQLSIDLINRNFPGASAAISDKKNSGNIRKNLYKFYTMLESSGQ